MSARVTATGPALAAIELLRAEHGAVAFFQSGGCCEGSSPICLRADEMPPGPNDVLLGEVGGAPVYIDSEQDRRWGHPSLLIDIAAGAATTFSLEGAHDVHFVTRTPVADTR
jgi:uncharacterized protein (DUF779 family)